MLYGERVRQLREGKYSQEELAEMLNVNNNTISKWETGTQEPRARKVAELARILETNPSYLLGESDDPSAEMQNESVPVSPAIREAAHTLVYERNGERLELPPTPESYAIMRELALRIASRGEQNFMEGEKE